MFLVERSKAAIKKEVELQDWIGNKPSKTKRRIIQERVNDEYCRSDLHKVNDYFN